MNELLGHVLALILAPLWLLAGRLDAACHKRLGIENTSGTRESLLHLLMLAQLGVGASAALLLEPNAAMFALLFAAAMLHEATMWVDLAYAAATRRIPWYEQWVHGLQQAMPWIAVAALVLMDPAGALSVLGLGDVDADWALRWRSPPLPLPYLVAFFAAAAVLVVVPLALEFLRCRSAERAASVGPSPQRLP